MIHAQEEQVMKLLKTLTAVRDDLRNFYVPAWLNKVSQARELNSFRLTLAEERVEADSAPEPCTT